MHILVGVHTHDDLTVTLPRLCLNGHDASSRSTMTRRSHHRASTRSDR
jgi:hypothetical protein